MATNQRTDAVKGGIVKVTLVKSPICAPKSQKGVVKSLGLRRIRHTVELKESSESRGRIGLSVFGLRLDIGQ